jgi:phage antirepressor YoqD-like protein
MRKCTGLEAQVNALQFTTSSLEQKVTSLEPKGDFYDAVNHAVNAIDFKTFAGMLISQATKKPYGRNTLLKDLRNHGILNYKNQPYQQYSHYFDVVTATKNNMLVTTTYVKPNGVTFISGKLKSIGLVA